MTLDVAAVAVTTALTPEVGRSEGDNVGTTLTEELVSSAVSERASTFLATSLIEYAISSIELTVSRTLPASSPMFSATSSCVAVISRIDELDSSALEGFMAGSVNARLTVSALPPLPFSSAVHDLIHYPYGCIEQTTTSMPSRRPVTTMTASLTPIAFSPAFRRSLYGLVSLKPSGSVEARPRSYSVHSPSSNDRSRSVAESRK